MRHELRRTREAGYLAATLVCAGVVVLAWSLPLPVRVLLGLASGFSLVGLVRWEASSEVNHRSVLRVVSKVRRLGFGILAVCLAVGVAALIVRG